MKKYLCLIPLLGLLCGCISQPKTIEVETTRYWENHYKNVNDFYFGTTNIKLDKDESIWVISNKTLSRLLKNTGK